MVLLVAIIMATVVNAFTGVNRVHEFKGLATRLAMRIEMARGRAIQANTEWGVFVDRQSISFASFDPINQQWQPRTERSFAQDKSELDIEFDLEIEAYPGQIEASVVDVRHDADVPDLLLFSSGEITPFALSLDSKATDLQAWSVSSDGISRAKAARSEE